MLHLHRATNADLLVRRLVDVLADAPDDPFQPDLVAVHSRGVERWVAQQLSHHLGTGDNGDDGVAANLEFPFPGTLVQQAVAAAGPVGADRPDPWAPERLAFTLLDLWDRGDLADVDLGGFGVHVRTGRHRRLPAFRHAAELLDGYQQHRPELVRAWVDWDGERSAPDGRGGTVPDHLAWQPHLVHALRARLGPTRVEAVDDATARLRAGTGPIRGLPSRLSLFALTALAATHFDVLHAITERIDVHAFLLHPSPAAWEADREAAAGAAPSLGLRPTRADTPLPTSGHPLVTGWARDSRELQVLLGGAGTDEPLDPVPDDPVTLLQRLQADVIANVTLPATDRWPLDPGDRSVQVHAVHGRHRQVEVARDAVLEALAEDPTLEPRDVVVMTPDVETFAPLVTAAFRAAVTTASGIPDVRVRLADRALLVTNPVLVALADVLALVDERFEAGRVLDLLRHEPIRAAVGIAEDDLELLAGHVDRARVKWGLDADHRSEAGLGTAVNTWRTGIDRMLTSIVAPDVEMVDGVVPLAPPVDAALVGRLAEFIARLRRVRGLVLDEGGEHAMSTWRAVLTDLADLLFGDTGGTWHRWQVDGVLAAVSELAGDTTAPVTLSELRGLLADRLAGRPSRANHQTGDLTVCSLVPMRTVPFRVVVVVGLDDGSWPRQRTRSGDDLLGLQPVVGDRDPASEDRQLLLDAMMAARDRLVITYRGAHQSTNQPVPPSVVVAELLDVIDDTAGVVDGDGPRELVVSRHPLRSADVRTFASGRPRFDRLAAAGAMAAQVERERVPPLVLAPPETVPPLPDTLTLEDLAGILANPARAWMRHVYGVVHRAMDDARDDNLAVEATGLEGWSLGTSLMEAIVEGVSLTAVEARLRDRGDLPVGRLARAALDDHIPTAVVLATGHANAVAERPGPVDEIEVDLDVADTRVRGVVRPSASGRLVTASYSSTKPKDILRGWIQIVAASAAGTPLDLVAHSKDPTGRKAVLGRRHNVPAPTPDVAHRLLTDLVAVAHWVRRRPTPLFTNTSGAYAEAVHAGKPDAAALRAASDHWSAGWRTKWGEFHDPNVRLLFGEAPLDVMVRNLPLVQPDGAPEWWGDESVHDFARWARWVYEPIWGTAEVTDLHGPDGPAA